MRQAWGFVVSSINEGLSGRAGLSAFREGGGVIRDSDWYYLRRTAQTAVETADYAESLYPSLPIPERAFAPLDWDLAQDYMAQSTLEWIDPESGRRKKIRISVESNQLLSKESWEEALLSLKERYPELEALDVQLGRIFFYKRTYW